MYAPFHIGIYTLDIDTSLAFYKGILDFEFVWRGVVRHPTGLVEAAVLRLGGLDIELVKPVDPDRVHSQAGPLQHMALVVPSLNEAIGRLRAKGVPLHAEGVEEIADFMGGIRHCFISGPSGERIEICERLTKGEKTCGC